jgi:hypothetical protein
MLICPYFIPNGMPKTGKYNGRKLVRPIQSERALNEQILLNLLMLVPWTPGVKVSPGPGGVSGQPEG